jgi:LemA protein
MRPEFIILFVFFSIVIFGWLIGTYNKFVKYQNRIEEAWSSIDVALKRRFNLIPNLIATIKGYSTHEGEIFENKTNQMKADGSVDERMASESQVSNGLSNLLAVAEAYPDLKASVNFLELQKNLNEIEADIQAARNRYNGYVARLNTLVESFPASLIATKFGFSKQSYFSLDLATQRELPEVGFVDKS